MFYLVLRDNTYNLSYMWKDIFQLHKKPQLYLIERGKYTNEWLCIFGTKKFKTKVGNVDINSSSVRKAGRLH